MHSFLIGLIYLAMLFAPCAAAQWGDVLTKPYFGLAFLEWFFAPRHAGAIARRNARAEAAELAALANAAFTEPVHLKPFRRAAPETFAEAMHRKPKSAEAIEKAAEQVATRLAQLVEAHRLINSVSLENEAVQQEALAFASVATADDFATPTYAELDELYALEQVAIPITLFSNVMDMGQMLHLLPDLAAISPPPLAHAPPVAIAA